MRLRQADSGASITSTFVLPAQSGVTVHERRAPARVRRAMAGFGQGSDWAGIYLAQREEAVKRHGKVFIDEGFARTAFPNVSRKEGLALLDWWWERLTEGVPVPRQGTTEALDVVHFAIAQRDLKAALSWGNSEIRGVWDAAQLAATRLSASATVTEAAEQNTWLRAFTESIEDITGNGTDPFGVGKWIRTILIGGGVIVGGLLLLRFWPRRAQVVVERQKNGKEEARV